MSIKPRPATESDLQAILDIYNDAILKTTAVYDHHPHTLEMRTRWFQDKLARGMPVTVLEHEGLTAGFGSYDRFRQWDGYKYSVEHSVYVEERFRSRGFGKALLRDLVERATAQGFHVMIAGIDASNDVSLRLHESLGFERVAHFREVGWKFGRWLDLVFLQRILA